MTLEQFKKDLLRPTTEMIRVLQTQSPLNALQEDTLYQVINAGVAIQSLLVSVDTLESYRRNPNDPNAHILAQTAWNKLDEAKEFPFGRIFKNKASPVTTDRPACDTVHVMIAATQIKKRYAALGL